MRAYFDNNATTPLDPRVLAAMLPWLGGLHGNPSSIHAWGQEAREAVERSRDQVARLLGASPPEVVFTASGTEANNTVVLSCARSAGFRGRLVISALEHPSVTAAAALAAEQGMEVVEVPPGEDGVTPAEAVAAAVTEDTRLVALMLAHNELGTLQPVAQVAAECRRRGVPVLCDAVQAAGKIPVDVRSLGVDYLTLGAHKFHGPLGAAALWIRSDAVLEPMLVGGSQERRRRASTVNVPAVVGLGEAAELAAAELPDRHRRLGALRDRFEAGLAAVPEAFVHGRSAPRLPNTSLAAFPGADATALLIRLDLAGFGVSSGAACGSGAAKPSRALSAMGVPQELATSALRLSFGLTNTEEEVSALVALLPEAVAAVRQVAPAGR